MKLLCILAACTLVTSIHAAAVDTAFTYQGRLKDGSNAPSGNYDFRFTLHDAASDGNQIGNALTNSAVVVSDGFFVVTLDFGVNGFPGEKRWLQIATRTNDSAVAFTTLAPRQPITATPYAILAETVSGVLTSNGLSGGYGNALTFSNPGNQFTGTFSGNGTGLSNLNATTLGGLGASGFWQLGGNSGTTPGTNFVGTTDNRALELRVNNVRALRLEPTPYNDLVNIVVGGLNSVASNVVAATIAGGARNEIKSSYSCIGGGWRNNIAADSLLSTIIGGQLNDIGTNANYSAIGGGDNNNIADDSMYGTIAGGQSNDVGINSLFSAIGGGLDNNIADDSLGSVIAGGFGNNLATVVSTIGGGGQNNIAADSSHGTIAGGQFNNIGTNASHSAIGGGGYNEIGPDSDASTIAGGNDNNIASDSLGSTIGGGQVNDIGTNSSNSIIGGGLDNNVANNAGASTIAGGFNNNIAAGSYASTITGGERNGIGTNSDLSVIGGGSSNNIGINSPYATIPGGELNSATNRAFAAGTRAKANHIGAFVWGDSTLADVASTSANSVTMRARGGYRLFSNTNLTAGVRLASGGGSWTTISDQSAKENFAPVNPRAVLEKVATLPVSTWNYKSQSAEIRHIGPMAQEFKAAFGVGETDTGITTIDADGVALAAIQGVNQKLEQAWHEKDMKIAQLEERLKRLEALVARDR